MATRPELPDGLLGALPKFSELKLKTDSHRQSEFQVAANNVCIRIKTAIPVKVGTKLTQCDGEKVLPDYVLTQRPDETYVCFHLGFPSSGWYTFTIFALRETDPSESMPNVYTYLIDAVVPKPARTYPKVYTKFYTDYCVLEQPMVLNAQQKHLDQVKFDLLVPGANKVAVHVGDEWFKLTKIGDNWQDTLDLHEYNQPKAKVQVMATYDEEGINYKGLLEYVL
ncbi:uncharacterized protein LOC131943812 [Physella acuta]|uniref:uncharacterized protein LOC131943812 n=1 Tax=Physella acuta TaxID=109671 RepID=UPI0027DB91C5|nr:uncharacterized protein LOC131943812 [Physella acuta]